MNLLWNIANFEFSIVIGYPSYKSFAKMPWSSLSFLFTIDYYLYRLALNVSSTRLILIDGSAGRVIETFGRFVVKEM